MRRTKILVVEDDGDLRRLFRTTLSMAGYDVEDAADGLDALRLIENDPPGMVVLDLNLPMIDGASVQQELAARALTRDIPVVIVTGSDIDIAGANIACVLRKPISADRLLHTVQHCLFKGVSASHL